MIILFYASDTHPRKSHLRMLHREIAAGYRSEYCTRRHELKRILGLPFPHKPSIAVLGVENHEELRDLIAVRPLFDDMRLILILPDRKKETLAQGHRLYPRFISHAGCEPADVGEVLAKMIGQLIPETHHRQINPKEEKMAATNQAVDRAVKDTGTRDGKYLTFTLAEEEYGIGILKIKEIMGMMQITTVPRTPDFVKGVINLRGKVIPVVDLRLKFGMAADAYDERTCIVVVEIEGRAGTVLTGLVVDSVSEVLNIKADDIEDAPTFGARLDMDYISGMAKTEGGVKILLDIDRVLNNEEIDVLNRAA